MKRSLSSLSSSLDGALQALSVDARTEYYFNFWKESNYKNLAGLLSDEEMSNQIEISLYDTIAGLKNQDAQNCLHGLTERFSLMVTGFYLMERVYHLEAVRALVKASEIICHDPEALPDEYLQRVDECKKREKLLMKEIDEILSHDIWNAIEERTGVMRPSIEYDWNKSTHQKA